jgi:heptosyltransferase-2
VRKVDLGSPDKILIRGTNWVGDSIICIPAMREIRRLFPKARISLLVKPWVKDIYSAVEFIDEIIEYDSSGAHKGIGGLFALASDLKKRQFDAAFLLQNAFEAAFIAWRAGIPERIGYDRDARRIFLTRSCKIDPGLKNIHQAYYYMGLLSSVGLIEAKPWDLPQPVSIRIGVREEDRSAARKILQSEGIHEGSIVIGINPGAFYGAAKRWFPERYAAVADALAQRYGASVVIFGAANDLRAAQEVQSNMKGSSIVLAGRTTLGQLMGLIEQCRLFITNDSGPMHIAAALDVPQLAIFGSTSEIATGPLSKNAEVIKHQVDCNPCFLRECPTDFRCMKGVTAEKVIEAAFRKLETELRLR